MKSHNIHESLLATQNGNKFSCHFPLMFKQIVVYPCNWVLLSNGNNKPQSCVILKILKIILMCKRKL